MKKTILLLAAALTGVLLHAGIICADEDEYEAPCCAGSAAASKAKFYGTVDAMPNGGKIGSWRVNGREIVVTRSTEIEEEYGKAAVGSYVEVEGCLSERAFIVHKLEVQENGRHRPESLAYNSRLLGTIEKMPPAGYEGQWIVAGRQVVVDKGTVIDETAGKAAPGCQAKITGTRIEGAIKATEIVIAGIH